MNRPDEHDEFLLSRFLDGDLSDEEADALNARLENEPALRAMLDDMTRIDSLLTERREERPNVDWSRFHARVMDQVSDESVPMARTLRFPYWLRVAVPVAVAASIALVVTLRSPMQVPKASPAPTMRVAYRTPAPAAEGRLVIAYRKPATATRKDHDRSAQEPIQVAYSQSEEQKEAIQKYDKARANRPLWHIYASHSETPELPAGDVFFDISAL